MSKCSYCGQKILFGGIASGEMFFCGEECRRNQSLTHFAGQISDDAFNWHVQETHHGACPQCDGPGPVDVHYSYVVYSFLVLTTWKTRPHVCCRKCAVKSQLGGMFNSGLVGWWGFPFGVIMTPVQLFRNLVGIMQPPDPDVPSDMLRAQVLVDLAELAEVSAQENGASSKQ